jgi:hypothetical protein
MNWEKLGWSIDSLLPKIFGAELWANSEATKKKLLRIYKLALSYDTSSLDSSIDGQLVKYADPH